MGLTFPFTHVTFTLFPVNQNIPGKPADPEPYYSYILIVLALSSLQYQYCSNKKYVVLYK